MKFHEEQEVAIKTMDFRGRGTASFKGRDLVIPFAFPGDVVRVRPVRRERGGIFVCEVLSFVDLSSALGHPITKSV